MTSLWTCTLDLATGSGCSADGRSDKAGMGLTLDSQYSSAGGFPKDLGNDSDMSFF